MTDTEPSHRIAEPQELLLAYLDHYRSTVARKLAGMSETDLRTAWLPSGWTPLELTNHLLHMERRWVRWGFAAEIVDAPWGDGDEGDRWEEGSRRTTNVRPWRGRYSTSYRSTPAIPGTSTPPASWRTAPSASNRARAGHAPTCRGQEARQEWLTSMDGIHPARSHHADVPHDSPPL